MVIIVDMVNRVQILSEDVCISHWADTLGKGKNSTIFHEGMNK